jgi:homocysteine S-methyltransferase
MTVMERVSAMNADFLCAAYNPGKLVRIDSRVAALVAMNLSSHDVIFTLSPRDMNKIALESSVLGAQALGLENVIVVQGDPLDQKEITHGVTDVNDYTPTALIAAIQSMNNGLDYRGASFRVSTNMCVGATIDIGRDLDKEASLTIRKIAAGTQFFVAQPSYDITRRQEFLEILLSQHDHPITQPIFWGVQILDEGGIFLNNPPQAIIEAMANGTSGVSIAIQMMESLIESSTNHIYLLPPIMKGGGRLYEAAQEVLRHFGR